MKEFALYTVARLGLFVATYGVIIGIYLLVTDNAVLPLFWPFLLAIVISSVASVYLLKGLRHRFALVVERRADAAARRFEQARSKEDEPDS